MISNQIAEASRNLAEAEEAHRAASERVTKIQSRIGECQQRQRAITQQRLEGEAGPETAAEFSALQGDVETLSVMLSAAQVEANSLQPAVDEARRRVAFTEQLAARELAQAEFEALGEKAVKLETALCRCIGQMHVVGRAKLGHSGLSQTWRPGDELHRAVHYGVAPTGV